MSTSFTQKRGVYVVLIGAIIIMLFIIGGMFDKNKNFDNANVNGVYLGSVSFPTLGIKQIQLTFDGEGLVSGRFDIGGNESQIDGEYYCISNEIGFTLQNELIILTFSGMIDTDYTVISGEATIAVVNENTYNGTLFISKN